MATVDFFKQKAKLFFKDYNSRVFDEQEDVYKYTPRFFQDIEDIILEYDIAEEKSFSLMNAQHIIALLAGFNKWNELIKATDPILEIGRLLIDNREEYRKKRMCLAGIVDDWKSYESMYLREMDDEAKLEIFKAVFLAEEKTIKETKSRRVKLDFSNDDKAQDMLCKLMKEKRVPLEKAILSSVVQKNCIKILSAGWAGIALPLWGHGNWGDPNYQLEKLSEPIISITFNADKTELIDCVRDAEKVSYKTAVLYFILFALESLGYHI